MGGWVGEWVANMRWLCGCVGGLATRGGCVGLWPSMMCVYVCVAKHEVRVYVRVAKHEVCVCVWQSMRWM